MAAPFESRPSWYRPSAASSAGCDSSPSRAIGLRELGSFFEASRRGVVYAMSADRRTGLARPPDEPGWSYDGGSLAEQLGDVRQVRLLREHVSGGAGDDTFSWVADRGLVLTSSSHDESVLLALPADSENAALISPPGLYRALFDPAALPVPGASPAELLGYGDRPPPFDLEIHLETLPPSAHYS